MKQARLLILALALLAVSVAMAACGGGLAPQDREFDLVIKDGKINLDPALISVKQGDNVTFRIKTDQDGEFHLHGYDLMQDIETSTQSVMTFTANATGRFEVAFHPAGEGGEEEEVRLLTVEVLPR